MKSPDPTPDHSALLAPEILDILRRAHWQTARTVTIAAGQHQYNVKGWDRDDISPEEFDLLHMAIKTFGRREEWHAPEGFYDDGRRPRYTNRYLYVVTSAGHHAYWFTWPRGAVPMLNREATSVQVKTPTRTVIAGGQR